MILNVKVGYKGGVAWAQQFEQTWRYGEVALKYKWSRRIFRNESSSKLSVSNFFVLRILQKLTGMASAQATPLLKRMHESS